MNKNYLEMMRDYHFDMCVYYTHVLKHGSAEELYHYNEYGKYHEELFQRFGKE